jgi:hypothetical protein
MLHLQPMCWDTLSSVFQWVWMLWAIELGLQWVCVSWAIELGLQWG